MESREVYGSYTWKLLKLMEFERKFEVSKRKGVMDKETIMGS